MTDLERLATRLDITELFARYAHALDTYDGDGWVACFTDDGVFEIESGGAGVQFIGRAALRRFAEAHFRLLPNTRHVMSNHVVDVDGANAKHKCTLTGLISRSDKVHIFVSGWYESLVTKIGTDWKIRHRIAHVDNPDNFSEGEVAIHMKPMMDWVAEHGTPASLRASGSGSLPAAERSER